MPQALVIRGRAHLVSFLNTSVTGELCPSWVNTGGLKSIISPLPPQTSGHSLA
jgi:hypothetical protein